MTRKKGEIRKLTFTPRTLDDDFVRDGLVAISLLNGKEPYYLVGGMATQSYLPTSCRRETSDIDFSIVRPLRYRDFKVMISSLREYLQDHGYVTETKKRSRAYSLDVLSKDGEGLSIEFAKRNESNFERNRKRLERELDNANSKILEERDVTYIVARPEDIAVPKLMRAIHSLIRVPGLTKYIPKTIESFTDEKIAKQLKKIDEIREEAMISPSDHELAEYLRFISDLYDIRVLSELTGFNQKYLTIAKTEWGIFNEPDKDRDKVMEVTFPNFERL